MTVAAQLFLVDMTDEDVIRVIDKLKIYKSPLGQIKSILEYLKKLKKQSASHFAQFSIYHCELEKVSEWKLANITPLFKKRDKSNPGNYRPISLTSVVSQIIGVYPKRQNCGISREKQYY